MPNTRKAKVDQRKNGRSTLQACLDAATLKPLFLHLRGRSGLAGPSVEITAGLRPLFGVNFPGRLAVLLQGSRTPARVFCDLNATGVAG
ncbi:MAG: hypothetical protein ACJASV_001981 [Pseudorhodobacter sp.]